MKKWLLDYEVEIASGGRFKASTLRKDRIGEQFYPFHRVKRSVFYDLAELDEAVAKSVFGGKAS